MNARIAIARHLSVGKPRNICWHTPGTKEVGERLKASNQIGTMESAEKKKTFSLVWFRVGDLRLYDHEPLTRACEQSSCNHDQMVEHTVVPFVIWKDRVSPEADGKEMVPMNGISIQRYEAMRRAIVHLEEKMKRQGSRLVILKDDWRAGLGAIAQYALEQGSSSLVFHYYMSAHKSIDTLGHEEQDAMLQELSTLSGSIIPIECQSYWGRTLFHPEDMMACHHEGQIATRDADNSSSCGISLRTCYQGSLDLVQSCDNMTRFREACQGVIPVRAPFEIPDLSMCSKQIDGLWSAVVDYILYSRDMVSYTYKQEHRDVVLRDDIPIDESQARLHLDTILSDPQYMSSYRTARMSASTSQKGVMLSTALSLGTMSPRTIYRAVEHRLLARDVSWTWKSSVQAASPGEEWLLMHLTIRDYFLYASELEAESIASFGEERAWSNNIKHFDKWTHGQTGYPFVDASMRELASTGFISNRSRQNVASFLTKALNIDWRWGASYFAKTLIDHEPGVNIESWAYVSGVGPGRRDSIFRTVTQGEKYDPEATSISKWIPELQHADTRCKHRPWLISDTSSISPYPQPIIADTSSQCRQ